MNQILKLNKNTAAIFLIVFLHISISAQEITPTNQSGISVIAVGDIMMGTDFPRNLLPPNDGKDLLKDVEPLLRSADITFGNLEGVLLDGGIPEKECKDTTTCYIFRTPTKYVKNLRNAGFNIMSLSNNHSNDFGESGRESTKRVLTNEAIKYAGIINETVQWTVKNVKFGMIAFSVSDNCYSILEISNAQREVRLLAKTCDIILVSFHGGAEGEDAKHVTGADEFMFEEERGNVLQFAHAVIDAGADLVLGHGPHVPRALELYKDRLIAYSLGNFCTYRGFSIIGAKGLAPILKININPEGAFLNGEIISAKQVRPGGTVLDKKNKAAKLIAELTKHDFPNTNLKINDSGFFERKEPL